MIKLKKVAEPAVLQQNSETWTNAILDKIRRGEEPTKSEKSRYNHPEVKSAILLETHDKCAYCECKIRHVTFGDIEHIVPKSVEPARWFEWDNLTLACDMCNTLKSNFVGNRDTFIDPYKVDPEEHFWHIGPTIHAKPGCDAAAKTEALLQLNRVKLVERRQDRLKSLLKHLEVIHRVADEDLKRSLIIDFAEETAADKEFAGLARDIARQAKAKWGLQIEA